jgi:hypothetical protein
MSKAGSFKISIFKTQISIFKTSKIKESLQGSILKLIKSFDDSFMLLLF